jgi:maltooligosyltrehalose trehalohydrolase
MTLHLLPPPGAATAFPDPITSPGATAPASPVAVDTGFAMTKDAYGYFHTKTPEARHGTRYYYMPDGEKSYPDPASPWQPEGVQGPSAVFDHQRHSWQDTAWRSASFSSLIFYELHVGAFTPEGTFEAIIPRLDELAAIGINALELMPVAQFPGGRNWGYDGVFLYAVQDSYGGPEGLKKLVDACHQKGFAVFLDVIYNHVGSEGNILDRFGPYFSDKYHTPWGKAFNFDAAWSDGVKEFIIGNAIYWAEFYHIDGLRLDAVHEIFDRNAVTIWDQLQQAVDSRAEKSGRRLYLVAESDLNSPRTVSPASIGGMGFDAQWLDDFHHSLYVLLDPDGLRHYQDFGRLEQLAKAYTEGFVHSDEYVRFRQRRHGASSAGIPGEKFIVFNQNHDIPGNRPAGERLSALVDGPRLRLAAAAVLLSPYVPMLFMGEEYGETAPFYFFSDYSDPEIIDGLLDSRKQQFASFDWDGEPKDSQDIATFAASRLNWSRRMESPHKDLLDWHKQLIGLRRSHPLLADLRKNNFRADLIGNQGLALYRHSADQALHLLCLLNFSGNPLATMVGYAGGPANPATQWTRLLDPVTSLPDSTPQALPDRIITGASVRLPPWGVAVYGINPSDAEEEPAIK